MEPVPRVNIKAAEGLVDLGLASRRIKTYSSPYTASYDYRVTASGEVVAERGSRG
jgi:hypothetical protein